MSTLFLLATALFALGPLLLASGALVDVTRRPGSGARRVWQALLLGSILTAAAIPGLPLASADRVRIIEGPDLLSGAPIERSAPSVEESWLGLRRAEVVRETQAGQLLREVRVDVVVLPLLPLLLGLGWFWKPSHIKGALASTHPPDRMET